MISQMELCYTVAMHTRRVEWQNWVQKLHQWHLNEPAAVLLEGAGPLTVFFAQFLYFGQPMLNALMPAMQWEALAHTLEDEEESRLLAARIRQEEEN